MSLTVIEEIACRFSSLQRMKLLAPKFAALRRKGRYWTNNGQSLALAPDGSAANDPKRTFLGASVRTL
jgi:hypothetical protein